LRFLGETDIALTKPLRFARSKHLEPASLKVCPRSETRKANNSTIIL
jgi:hypothetical protein